MAEKNIHEGDEGKRYLPYSFFFLSVEIGGRWGKGNRSGRRRRTSTRARTRMRMGRRRNERERESVRESGCARDMIRA
jgi:hypothetical protein